MTRLPSIQTSVGLVKGGGEADPALPVDVIGWILKSLRTDVEIDTTANQHDGEQRAMATWIVFSTTIQPTSCGQDPCIVFPDSAFGPATTSMPLMREELVAMIYGSFAKDFWLAEVAKTMWERPDETNLCQNPGMFLAKPVQISIITTTVTTSSRTVLSTREIKIFIATIQGLHRPTLRTYYSWEKTKPCLDIKLAKTLYKNVWILDNGILRVIIFYFSHLLSIIF